MTVGIIDYGVGNIRAFVNIYNKLGVPVKILQKPEDFEDVTNLILPGVGSFDYAMTRLQNSGMRVVLDELVLEKGMPVIGVCVGMQMLAKSSDEGKMPGLGWINATVRKFDPEKIPFATHLPHMGWNDVHATAVSPLFKGLDIDSKFYFLHSYYFQTDEPQTNIAVCNYGIEFCCAVSLNNIYGVQFHPEKSHHYGIGLLKNFSEL